MPEQYPMMACGHKANGVRMMPEGQDDIPSCVICSCTEVAEEKPNLEGRMARCQYYKTRCHNERPSTDRGLAFFAHKPDSEYDEYYCGCYGWD